MLPNEVFALECLARYAKEGLVVDSSNGQFAHCPYPKPKEQKKKLAGDLGYWLTFYDHQKQGLLQSVDVGRKCYFSPDAKLYLDTYPPNYFELYDIYDKFNKPTEETKKKMSEARSGEKNWQHNKAGEDHPLFGVPRTEEAKKKISEALTGRTGTLCPMYGRTGASANRSKAVIVIKPDGTKLHFSSGKEAAKALRMSANTLCRRIKSNKPGLTGRFKNYQFFYAE